ncbi:hypothetical protein PGIGA_G00158510 [Pangasianodon gigas]|uniref:Uncharacterized protein n=1 Tax=Pangasianodon gigas TaxID=30993 RepID=A0ACC5XR07_PANGG|nr:hypothetical protein [Pangasianodon gigas]
MLGSVLAVLLILTLQTHDRAVEGLEQWAYDYTKYHTMDEISEWMKTMERDYPDVVSSIIYGNTYEKRNITLLKIGLSSTDPKKMIWMDCGIHAREWIAPAFCQHFVKEILGSYKTDPKIGEMLRHLDFYITPVLNMDGYVYSWKDNTVNLQYIYKQK